MRTKLRGKVTLLIIVCAALLAFAGTAMAITADPSGNIAPAPTIQSDKADYSPGELVTLTGSNWQPGESINIVVNDDAGQTWNRNVNVTADQSGNISDSFNLPNWFVATYSVTATGAQSDVATTTFTDRNLRFLSSGPTLSSVSWQKYSDSTCTTQITGTGSSGSGDINTNDSTGQLTSTLNVEALNNQFVKLTAPATAGGQNFSNWTRTSGNSAFTTSEGGRTICVAGDDNSGLTRFTANYVAAPPNSAPVISRNNASVSVNEGQTAMNTGTWSDAASDTVTLSASVGQVQKNANGTWSWSYATTDGPDQSQTVTITATDNHGASSQTTFGLTVTNVAPTTTLILANPTSVNESSTTEHTYNYTISDPGADTIASPVNTSCGTNGEKVTNSDQNTNTGGSFTCKFDDGSSTKQSSTVSAQATDSDGLAGNTATQTVNIANVAPDATFVTPSGVVNQGDDFELSFTNPSDPSNADTQAGFTYAFDCNGDNNFETTETTTPQTVTCSGFSNTGGQQTVKGKITDKDNGATVKTGTVTINSRPSADANGPYDVDEGDSIALDSTGSSDPENDTLNYNWDFNYDGQTFDNDAQGASPNFSAQNIDGDATRTVALRVTDSHGAQSTISTSTVDIHNVAPSVNNLTGHAQVAEDKYGSVTYTFLVSDPGNDQFTVNTDCGDGGTEISHTNDSLICRFADGPASPTVSVSATDDDGDTGDAATHNVTVDNVEPTVNLSGLSPVDEGTTHTYSFSVNDPGADTHSVTSYSCDPPRGTLDAGTDNYDDTTKTGSLDCTFPDGPATANVTVRVADDDDAADADNRPVSVNVLNVAPTVTAPSNQSSDEGANHAFDLGSFTDPGPDSSWTVDVDWGDGSNDSTSKTSTGSLGTMNHTYTEGPATKMVTVKVTDKDGDFRSQSFTVTVKNANPVISTNPLPLVGADGTACLSGNTVTLNPVSFTDAGTADTHTGTVEWGDKSDSSDVQTLNINQGNGSGTTASLQHTYVPGTYTLTVTITDDDGGAGSKTASVSKLYKVTQPDGSVLLDPVNANGTSVFKLGSVIPLKVKITDCFGNPVSGLAPKVGYNLASATDPTLGVNEGVTAVNADNGNLMRPVDSFYMYNLATKSLPDSSATYKIIIMDSKATQTVPAAFGPQASQNLGIRK